MEDINFYNKHYIRIREDGCIIDGFSDAFREATDDAICINEQGGYQFRLHYKFIELDGEPWYLRTEENPSLFDWNGMIPLYKWDGGVVVRRTDEELEAERAEMSKPTVSEQIAELKEQLEATDYKVIKCSEAQLAGEEMPYDVAALHAERQALRDQINALETTV